MVNILHKHLRYSSVFRLSRQEHAEDTRQRDDERDDLEGGRQTNVIGHRADDQRADGAGTEYES